MPVAETTFGIEYDGPALRTGPMAVRDLAPALLALGDIFTEASRLAYKDAGPVALNIQATEQGSFVVRLILEGSDIWDQVVSLLTSKPVTALANLKSLIIGSGMYGGYGLLRVLQLLAAGASVEDAGPAGIKLTTPDGVTIEIGPEVGQLVKSVRVRQRVRDAVAPLKRDGVDELRVSESPEEPPAVTIRKDEVAALEAAIAEPEDVLSDEEVMMHVQLGTASFEGPRHWRLNDGVRTFPAVVEDEGFLAAVEQDEERFAASDVLRVRMRIVQKRRADGKLKAEYHVLEVLEHRRAAEQQPLFEAGSSDEGMGGNGT